MQRKIRQSEIKTFKTCKREWYLEYVRSLAPLGGESSTADLGTMVHKALEFYYTDRDWSDAIDAEAPEAELASIMVAGYVDWVAEQGMDVGLHVVGVEEPVEVSFGEFNGDEVIVTGRQDLILWDEALDETILMDHKTVQNLDQAADNLIQNEQLLTYITLRRLSGQPISGAAHNSLRRVKRTASAKPPFYGRRRITPNGQQLDNHLLHMRAAIGEMVATAQALELDDELHQRLAYPNPGRECGWRCDFFHVCPMMDDGSNWEGYLSNFYVPKGDY